MVWRNKLALTGPYSWKSSRPATGGRVATSSSSFLRYQRWVMCAKPLRSSGVANGVFGGWKLNSIDSFYSGSPFSVVSGTNTLGAGAGTQRADLIGNWHVPNPGPSRWFNPAAFATPAPYQYGNSGRNIVVGPGTRQVDLSLFKSIPLMKESQRLEFRAEVFNLFNTPQFDNPNESGATATSATIGIPSAGTLNYAGNPAFFQRTSREIQLAMKVYF